MYWNCFWIFIQSKSNDCILLILMSVHGKQNIVCTKTLAKAHNPWQLCLLSPFRPIPPASMHASLWLACSLPINPALQPGFNTTKSHPAPSSKHQNSHFPEPTDLWSQHGTRFSGDRGLTHITLALPDSPGSWEGSSWVEGVQQALRRWMAWCAVSLISSLAHLTGLWIPVRGLHLSCYHRQFWLDFRVCERNSIIVIGK